MRQPLASSADSAAVRIALVSDVHETRGTEPQFGGYRERFDKAIAAVNAAHVDLVLVAGDLTDTGEPEQMADFKTQAALFTAPVRWVPGNHDIGNKVLGRGKGEVTAESVALFQSQLGPSYFAETFTDLGLRLVAINASILGSGLPVEADQWAFLEQELAPRSDARPTIVMIHYPLYTEQPDEPSSPYWNVEPEPRVRLLALLDADPSIRAVLSGHLHRPLCLMRGDVLLYSTPPVSFGLPIDEQPEGWTLVTVPHDPARPVLTDFRTVAGDTGTA